MAIIDSVIVFVVSLLVGALGIYIGGRVVTDTDDYGHAIITALIGALVWGVLGWVPLLGPLLALIAYIAVIKYRYPGGWLNAVAIALIAWVASLVVLYILSVLGFSTIEAFGVPGT